MRWAGTTAKGRFLGSVPAVLGQGGRRPSPGALPRPYLSRAPRSPRAAAAAHMAPRAPRADPTGRAPTPRPPVPAHKRSGGHCPALPGRGRPPAL